jgi:hypothetical protein
MVPPCDNIELFVDGELAPEQAEAFRQHLPDCTRCQREVTDLLQLKLLAHRHLEQAEEDAVPAPLARIPPSAWRRPVIFVPAALAAGLMVLVAVRFLLPSASMPRRDVWLAQRSERLLEARLSHPGADVHRPPAAKMMSGAGHAEELQLEAMAWLEREDPHGLVAAYLVRNDQGLVSQARAKLEKLGRSPDLDNDRAVALLLQGKPTEALQLVDGVLEKHPGHRQALWNRGLALRELELPLLAAQAFSEVAALKEPGWSEEAAQKAKALRREVSERRERWKATEEAGKALLEAPPGTLPAGFSHIPIARLFFYDAVRAAPDRERVLALSPLARELDARAGNDVLERYVRRVAEADFSRRAPLARRYVDLVRKRLSPEDQERFLAELLQSREDDILLGALVLSGATARHQQVYDARAAATGDHWFQLLVAQTRAKAERNAGRWTHAIRTLLAARDLCPTRGLEYRCLYIERELSSTYILHRKFDAARTSTERGWREARAHNEWELEDDLLWNLSQLARVLNDATLTRAYLGEYLERGRVAEDPMMQNLAHQDLAIVAIQQLRVDEARREFDAALAMGLPLSYSGAFFLTDISRLKSAPGDEAHLEQALKAAEPKLTRGERAVATHILGRFYIERDAERGRALLWRAIEEAGAPGLEEDRGARRARAYSYTSLLQDAGRRGAFTEALELFTRERGRELPGQCLLAVTADSERTLLLARGSSGELLGHYDEARRQPLPRRLDGLVPERLLAALRSCPRVEVLARPPLHGRAGLLPPELAWSYLTSTTPARSPPTGPAVHLVVSDVKLPPDSTLERLNSWTPAFGPNEQRVTLSGAEATPSRVLAAMRDATEIDLVAHGIIDGDSNTSYLQLAPGEEETELSVPRVRSAALKGAPFVVLAACHAAHTAHTFDTPFSLPAAFIEAGARGVLAATVQIPDLQAEAFFNAVRERIRSGIPPALALRDERVQWLRAKRGEQWLDSVLLFE